MWSPNAPSLNTHQLALSNLKERCSKQQKKLDDLERDKLVLNIENEELAKTLRKMNDDNMDIREKNLEINHELKQSQFEIVQLKRKLDQVGISEIKSENSSRGESKLIIFDREVIGMTLLLMFLLLLLLFLGYLYSLGSHDSLGK